MTISRNNKAKGKGGKTRKKEPTGINSSNGRNVSQYRKSSAALSGLPTNYPTFPIIITSWNIRGLNSKGKQRYLEERIKKEKPQIMLLQETKIIGGVGNGGNSKKNQAHL